MGLQNGFELRYIMCCGWMPCTLQAQLARLPMVSVSSLTIPVSFLVCIVQRLVDLSRQSTGQMSPYQLDAFQMTRQG